MRECLISEADTRALLSPHHEALEKAIRGAYAVWETVAPLFQRPLKRTRAQVVSNAYYDRALAARGCANGIRTVEENERLLLAVDDRVVLRFKRLDRDQHTRNYSTRASRAMDGQKQVEIPDIGHLPRVVLGYMLDGIPAKLIDIRVVFAISNRVLWSYPIDGSASGTLPLPFDRTPPSEDGFQFRMLGEEDEGDQAVDGDEGG